MKYKLMSDTLYSSDDQQFTMIRSEFCTQEKKISVAEPEYKEHEEPAEVGWLVNRMPVVNHALLKMSGTS